MMSDAQIIHELGLLSWKTAEVGFRRNLIDGETLEELAVIALGQSSTTDSELAALCTIDLLSQTEIEDLLDVVVERFDPLTNEETAVKRWCLGRLIGLGRKTLAEELLLDRMAEVYAEFGFPTELDCVSRYYFTPEERAAGITSDKRYATGSESLEQAVANLQASLENPPM